MLEQCECCTAPRGTRGAARRCALTRPALAHATNHTTLNISTAHETNLVNHTTASYLFANNPVKMIQLQIKLTLIPDNLNYLWGLQWKQ